jgi:hypothetical protein
MSTPIVGRRSLVTLHMASLNRAHVRLLSLDHWVKSEPVERCIRTEICQLTRMAWKIPHQVANWDVLWCQWLKIIWLLGKRINESETYILPYLSQCLNYAVLAILCCAVPYASHKGKVMGPSGESQYHMVEAGTIWWKLVPCDESQYV